MNNVVYANVVRFRLSDNELLLDFGAIFPDKPTPPGVEPTFESSVRVVMPPGTAEHFIKGLQEGVNRQQQALAAAKKSSVAQ
jgi:hypothetical protein